MKTRILLADDHSIFRQGIRALLEQEDFEVVAEADNGADAVALVQQLAPEVAVLDISMPGIGGVEVARWIRENGSKTQVVLLSAYEEDAYAREAHQAGARGYVSKAQAASDLADVIRKVIRNSLHGRDGVYRSGARSWSSRALSEVDPLTPRERQVLELIALGKTTREAAAELGISMKTADSHRTHIMSKLGMRNTSGLVRYAVRKGIIRA